MGPAELRLPRAQPLDRSVGRCVAHPALLTLSHVVGPASREEKLLFESEDDTYRHTLATSPGGLPFGLAAADQLHPRVPWHVIPSVGGL